MNFIKFLKQYQADIILALTVVLISITAFNLGKISIINKAKTPITITQPEVANNLETINYSKLGTINSKSVTNTQKLETGVVASKASKSKVYHFPWCASGSKISEKNKITFATEVAAISAGYTLAGNCKK